MYLYGIGFIFSLFREMMDENLSMSLSVFSCQVEIYTCDLICPDLISPGAQIFGEILLKIPLFVSLTPMRSTFC